LFYQQQLPASAIYHLKSLCMQLMKTLRQLEYVDYLIRHQATGTPKQFAERLHISERQLYRIIDDLRSMGFPISYSADRHCYHYEAPIEISIHISIDGTRVI
jgi:hypothetical protein